MGIRQPRSPSEALLVQLYATDGLELVAREGSDGLSRLLAQGNWTAYPDEYSARLLAVGRLAGGALDDAVEECGQSGPAGRECEAQGENLIGFELVLGARCPCVED